MSFKSAHGQYRLVWSLQYLLGCDTKLQNDLTSDMVTLFTEVFIEVFSSFKLIALCTYDKWQVPPNT